MAGRTAFGVAAGEGDRAGVTGRHVAIGVVGRDGDVIRRARGDRGGSPVTVNVLAAAAWTTMFDSVLLMPDNVSVAVIDWVPAVSSVTGKVCLPASAVVKM